MTKHSYTSQRKTRRTLDIILSRKMNKPKAYRALKRKDYTTLLGCHCPRMIRYKPSKEIARAVVEHVTKDIPRLNAKQLAWKIYRRLHMLSLRIGVEKPNACYMKIHKLTWYEMGIRDIYIRNELARYFISKKYTHRVGTKKVKSQKYKFRTIFIQTYE